MKRARKSTAIGVAGLCALLLVQGCLDLDETPLSAITPENFYRTEKEILGGVASVYAGLRSSLWSYYNLSEITTDEIIVPTRGPDWFDGGRWLEIHRHTWSEIGPSTSDDINAAWNDAFTGVARANVLLGVLPNVAVADKDIVTAEVRTLRAFYYYILMDLFGGVPIAETVDIMPRERPTRAELFAFIEKELTEAREELPVSWPASSHGRMTKGAADAVLASMYLNAEVFTGTVTESGLTKGAPQWQKALDATQRILDSGQYSLAADWFANFRPDNHTSPENIFVVKNLNSDGLGFEMFYRAAHYNSGANGGWNGFSTLASVYFAFDTAAIEVLPVPGTSSTAALLRSNDLRHKIFLAGQHFNVDNGTAVNDRAGVPLFLTPEIRDATAAAENEGVRIYKWPVDPNRAGTHHSNDFAYFRLGEILLIRAEALNELNRPAEAVTLINTVRARVFNPDKPMPGAATQDNVREQLRRERLFELTAEAKRRQDLIRYGRFGLPWAFKTNSDPYRILMPIPRTQLDANPLLVQNPGY